MDVLVATALGSAIAAAAPAPATQQPSVRDTLPFELELLDQRGDPLRHARLDGRNVALIVADRAARSAATAWGRSLRRLVESRGLEPRWEIVRVADLRRVPLAFRPAARAILADRYETSLYLDWTGAVGDALGTDGSDATVLLFDATGRAFARFGGAPPSDDEGRRRLLDLVESEAAKPAEGGAR